MAQVSGHHANLATVVRVVLDQVREHVNDAPWHAFHARLSRLKCTLEQTREIIGRSFQGLSCLSLRDGAPIESRGARLRAAHPCKRAPDTLHVSHNRGNRTAASGWR
jgi:hypothetical protein